MTIDIGLLPDGARVANYLYPNMNAGELHQDLLTIALANGALIEVGWFPEYDENGEYWVHASWDSGETPPVKTRDLARVQSHVRELISRFSQQQFVVTGSTSTENIKEVSLQ